MVLILLPLLYTNLIAPAVYFVFPPAKYSLAFSKIFTVAPFSSAEIPAHKAALPDPTISFFGHNFYFELL